MTSPEAAIAEQEYVEALVEDLRTDPRDVLRRIRSGDNEVDAALERPMGIVSTQDNKTVIYHTVDGDARTIPTSHLRRVLQKKLPDGRRAFSVYPTGEPVKGQVKCYLHPEHPDYQKWRAAGIATVCMSGKFASVVDMEAQMAHKHSRDWAKIKEILEQERRDEDRAFQRELMNRMTAQMAGPVVTATSSPAVVTMSQDTTVTPFACDRCGQTFDKMQGLTMHQNRWCKGGE